MSYKKSPLEILKNESWFIKSKPRILIIMDWENYRRLLNFFGWKLEPKKLCRLMLTLLPGSKIVGKKFFAGVFPEVMPHRQETFDLYQRTGFRIITKPVKKITSSATGKSKIKADLDVDIAIEVMLHTFASKKDFPNYDLLLFLGGDGDYAPLFSKVIEEGKQVLIFSGYKNIGKENFNLTLDAPQFIQYIKITDMPVIYSGTGL